MSQVIRQFRVWFVLTILLVGCKEVEGFKSVFEFKSVDNRYIYLVFDNGIIKERSIILSAHGLASVNFSVQINQVYQSGVGYQQKEKPRRLH